MTRNLAILLPALLLACDTEPAASDDTDGTNGTDASSDAGPSDDEPDPTTGQTPDSTTGEEPDATTGGDPDATTGEGPDPTTGEGVEAVCGDGIVEGDEACDDGELNGTYGRCQADCDGLGPRCGDGHVDDRFEDCDDGKFNGDYDRCSADCSGPGPSCGDGVVDAPEACDDGVDNGSYDHCALDCAGSAASCGDGIVDVGFEDCDDGDAINGNGCNTDCVVSGTMLWELTKTTIGEDSNDQGRDVAVMADGTVRVAANARVSNDVSQIIITDYDQDGVELDEYIHINGAASSVGMGVYGLHPEGTYNLVRWSLNNYNGFNVDARSADSMLQDWTITTDEFRVLRRAGGGGLYVEEYETGNNSDWFMLDGDGDVEASSISNPGVRYWEAAEAESDGDVIVVESVTVGGGFQPAVARHAADGTVLFRTFYSSALEDHVNDWTSGIVGVGPQGEIAVAYTHNGDLAVVRFAADGAFEHEVVLSADDVSANVLTPTELAFDGDGRLILGGRVRTGFFSDGAMWKFDTDGTLLWSYDLVGPTANGYESISAVTILDDDSIIAVGSYTPIVGSSDIWVSRFAP